VVRDDHRVATVDERAREVARTQRGRATRRQLREDASVSTATIARRIERGSWSEPLPGVIDLRTHEPSWLTGATELLLATGPCSWLSHRTAANLHEFLDVARPDVPDVLVERGSHTRIAEVRLHTTVAIASDEVTVRDGLRCTTAARTLLDLAVGATLDELERFGLDLARRDRASLRQIGELLDRYRATPGRRRLLTALARLPGDASLLGSPLEVLGVQELLRLGAPPPRLQYVVRGAGGDTVERVDAAWPELRVIVEFDGRAYHDASAARAADELVRAELRQLGWRVVVFRRADLGGEAMRTLAAELAA
jgi:hypothetical protein